MQKTLILPVAALLVLPLVGCGKIQARAELKKGNSYYTQEQYSKALDYYKKGLELDPDATFAWRSVGLSALALYRPGDNDPKNQQYATTAIDAFEKFLADNPNDSKIDDYLLATYVNAEKYNEALAFIDRRSQGAAGGGGQARPGQGQHPDQGRPPGRGVQAGRPAPGRRQGQDPLLHRRHGLGQGLPRSREARRRRQGQAGRPRARRPEQGARHPAGLRRRDGLHRPPLPREVEARHRRRAAAGGRDDRLDWTTKAIDTRKKKAAAQPAPAPANT